MPNYTDYLQLYKPSREDKEVEVDTSLQTNFDKIDQELKLHAEQLKQTGSGGGTAGVTEEYTATEGQTVFPVSVGYEIGTNALIVEIDGVEQRLNEGYTETSTNSITVAEPLIAGQIVTINVNKQPFTIAKDVIEKLNDLKTEVMQIGTTTVTYDADDYVSQIVTPIATITYQYTDGRVSKITEVQTDKTIETNFNYDTDGTLTSFTKAVI